MAKNRPINSDFWVDSFFESLSVTERFLFLYFLTNEQTNIAGIYKTTIRKIAFDTQIGKDKVLKAIDRLSKADKLYYIGDYILIVNFLKYQKPNEKMKAGIGNILKKLPDEVKAFICSGNSKIYDRLSIVYDMVLIGFDRYNKNKNKNKDQNINQNINQNRNEDEKSEASSSRIPEKETPIKKPMPEFVYKTKQLIPDNFHMTKEMEAYAVKHGFDKTINLKDFTEKFILSCESKGYKYKNFQAAWKNWLRDEASKPVVSKGNSQPTQQFKPQPQRPKTFNEIRRENNKRAADNFLEKTIKMIEEREKDNGNN